MPKSVTLNLRPYPRGFLGASISSQSERTPRPFDDRLAQLQYSPETNGSHSSNNAGNPFVESAYSSYVKESVNSGSFEFRKKVLLAALNAFGTNRFDYWYQAQFSSKSAGDLHARFLSDTLHYITTGVREMSLETWGSLLSMTDEGNSVGTIPKEAKDFFGTPVYPRNTDLTEVIQAWCCHASGIEDLLGTLHILFGNV